MSQVFSSPSQLFLIWLQGQACQICNRFNNVIYSVVMENWSKPVENCINHLYRLFSLQFMMDRMMFHGFDFFALFNLNIKSRETLGFRNIKLAFKLLQINIRLNARINWSHKKLAISESIFPLYLWSIDFSFDIKSVNADKIFVSRCSSFHK